MTNTKSQIKQYILKQHIKKDVCWTQKQNISTQIQVAAVLPRLSHTHMAHRLFWTAVAANGHILKRRVEWLNPEYWHRSSLFASVKVKEPIKSCNEDVHSPFELNRSQAAGSLTPTQSHFSTQRCSSMISSKSLCVFQTVCLHLDGHHMVTWDHGQAQHSRFTLGKCVWRQKGMFLLKKYIKYLDLSFHWSENVFRDCNACYFPQA